MQILVVVANIQVRTLKAEVEKGSMGTAVGHGSGGPKRSGDSVQSRGVPYICICVCVYIYAGSPSERKGIGLIFPTLPTEIGGVCVLASTHAFSGVCACKLPASPSAATQTNSETSARVPGRVFFSL